MKLNEEKRHLLVFGEKDTKVSINVGSSVIKESNEEKLLGVIIDRKLKQHLLTVCKKGKSETTCPCKGFDIYARRKNMNSHECFVISQLSYCPLIWIFHYRVANSKINHIHERALRIAYQNFTSGSAELLINHNSVSTHQ